MIEAEDDVRQTRWATMFMLKASVSRSEIAGAPKGFVSILSQERPGFAPEQHIPAAMPKMLHYTCVCRVTTLATSESTKFIY